MAIPMVAGTKPAIVTLKKDETVYWCSCGRSQKQPFCDGSHADTEFEPVVFTAPKDDDYYFCTCKRSETPPFCDGAHKRLLEDD